MITSDRMAAVDENAAALGVPRKQLMESSGNAVAAAVRERTAPGDRVAIVAGRGNNGGDAFVAARFLSDRAVTVLLLGRAETIATEIARENWTALQRADVHAAEVRDSTALSADPAATAIDGADCLVDAMLGTGVTGALREPAATAARRLNDADAPVVAVDVPSGVDADTGEAAGVAVEADHVVTFHDEKPGLADLDAGVEVADIGIPEAATVFVERGDLLALGRDPAAHKGDHGHVLVVGGGPYTGAPALAAQAALRAGADLATVATPESAAEAVAGYSENLLVESLAGERLRPGHVDRLLELAAERDVVVFGPGLGREDDALDAAREFLASVETPTVVDADPLRVVPDVEPGAPLLCTPHRGELAAMDGPEALVADGAAERVQRPSTGVVAGAGADGSDGAGDDTSADAAPGGWREQSSALADFAAELGATLLLKGPYDLISDGETWRVNRTGNPGMTVGGTGDVLAGVCGALLARLEPIQAGAVGAFATGRAGDAAVDERGHGLVATDLLEALPAALGRA